MLNAQEKSPNIVWIVCEDISPFIGAYGDSIVSTPNIDRLASEGVKYTRVFTVAGVCAPSRSSIITGMYPTSIGTQHMRTTAGDPKYMGEGVPNYSAVIPAEVKAFPEFLRKAGYYTSNNEKEDYQFDAPVTVWDESSAAASYTNRPENAPFFSVYNLFVTHESQMFVPPDTLLVDPADVRVPAFYEDAPITRRNIAHLLTNIQIMDEQVGEIISHLKKEGLYEDSYIFFYSDHGGNLPWMKREILERGTHIPFVVKHPQGKYAGTTVSDLISSVDFAPTVLSIAGVELPSYFQGKAFLGEQSEKEKRSYIFAARDRMDELYDRVRAVRDTQFRYIYNYMPEKSRYQDLSYRKNMPLMKELLFLNETDQLDPPAAEWFKSPKPVEELYDVENDREELKNLVMDPQYKNKLKELRQALQNWIKEVGDMSEIPEKEMVLDLWWNGQGKAPTTDKAEVIETPGGYILQCATEGASIGYIILQDGQDLKGSEKKVHTWDGRRYFTDIQSKPIKVEPVWQVYDDEVISLKKGEKLVVNAMRIGYQASLIEFNK
ncbi:sulfatase [uncultured Salegentibacter sp.]|uniref:sulfatase family protein n=1 Tax=uncultured Salegentibacter sp. TaxID=259320 RepID=UPI0030D7B0A1